MLFIIVLIAFIIIVMVSPLKKPALILLKKLSLEGKNEKRNKLAKQYVKIGLVITIVPFAFSWFDLLFVNHSNDVMGMGRFISEIVVTTYSICLIAVIIANYLRNSIVKIVITTLVLIPSLLLIILLIS